MRPGALRSRRGWLAAMRALVSRISSVLAAIVAMLALASCMAGTGSFPSIHVGAKGHEPSSTPWPHGTAAATPSHPSQLIVLAQGLHTLIALEAKKGHILWTAALDGASPVGRPAINGHLVVAAASNGTLHAFQLRTGTPVWSASVGPLVALASEGSRIDVLARSPSSIDETLAALDAATGRMLWHYDAGTAASSLLTSGSTIFLVQHQGNAASSLLSIDATTGSARSAIPMTFQVDDAASAIADGRGYVVCDTVAICAVNLATGALAWRYATNSAIPGGVVAAGGTIFAGTGDGALLAIDARSGKPIFTFQANGPVLAQPLVVGPIVYLVTANRTYDALNARNGALLWDFAPDSGIRDAGVAGLGMIFQPVDGNVQALDAAIGIVKWTFLSGDVITVSCSPLM
jgi:outer membrane protein assembly factor BamB